MQTSHESEVQEQGDVDERTQEPQAAGAQEDLTAELARLEDRYKRALADLDNYRKRTSREIERRVAEVKESLLRDWLEAVDTVERAIRIEHDERCLDGLRAVIDQMDAVLARQGAQRIGAAGDPFDPERHEAIAVQASDDVADRTVLAVERSGYAIGDRVIRPAQVVVARTPEQVR
jgi:molecular chaperone GrpE